MNLENEAAIDVRLASLSEDDLRAVAKASLALAASLIHHQQEVNRFLHSFAAQFCQAGEKFGRQYELQIVPQLKTLEAIFDTMTPSFTRQ
jgi:hypothetical protein